MAHFEPGGAAPIPAGPVTADRTAQRQLPNFWLIAGLVLIGLFAAYWLVWRPSYVPVLVNLDPLDAADAVKVLEKSKIPYRLEAQGRTVTVPADQADPARLELAGSELPMKGQIGFELFDQSDMGLTEFAQKINYQRALQGELARSILLMNGIQTARVHLGLPERSIFRAEQVAPKAAVTLVLKPGAKLAGATVAGIQRLVAGATPDLPADAVTVLDGSGRIVSTQIGVQPAPESASEALVETARNRVLEALAQRYPGQRLGINISLRFRQDGDRDPALPNPPAAAADSSQAGLRPDLAARGIPDYVYAVRLTSEQPLDNALQQDLQATIDGVLSLDPQRGDSLVFLVGPIPPDAIGQRTAQPAPLAVPEGVVAQAAPQKVRSDPLRRLDNWLNGWPILLGLGLATIVILWAGWRSIQARRKRQLVSFAALLQQRLTATASGATP